MKVEASGPSGGRQLSICSLEQVPRGAEPLVPRLGARPKRMASPPVYKRGVASLGLAEGALWQLTLQVWRERWASLAH